jgi:molecular chaperone GrpE (heat shock protein)
MIEVSKNLHDLMAKVGLETIDELGERSGLSIWYLFRVEGGLINRLPLEACLTLAEIFGVSLTELIQQLSPSSSLTLSEVPEDQHTGPAKEISSSSSDLDNLQREYEKLKQQLEDQERDLIGQWQAQSLAILEPWLMQWPTASTIAKTMVEMPAVRLLPLIKPLENLVSTWGLEAIGKVGQMVNYDPTCHELLEGEVEPGTSVIIRYIGYRQNDRLWCRAKVSIPEDETT